MNRTRYVDYLRRITGAPYDYTYLFRILLDIPFEWDNEEMPTDSNRATDGLRIRDLYFKEYRDHTDDDTCSIIEMLIGFSIRIEQEIMGEPGVDRPERWFWIMLDNLGLGDMIGTRAQMRRIDIIRLIDRFNNREYGLHGEGSLFPLRFYEGDQRLLSLWDQMSEYLNENF